jgi:hypothetical protein
MSYHYPPPDPFRSRSSSLQRDSSLQRTAQFHAAFGNMTVVDAPIDLTKDESDNDDECAACGASDLASDLGKLKNEVAFNKLKLYVQSHITAKTMADKLYPLKLWDSAIDMVTLGTERGLADMILGLADKWHEGGPNNFVVSADLSELVRLAMEDGNKENILAPSCGFMSYLFIALSVSDLAFAVVQNPKKFLGISEGEEELDYDMYDVESELHRWSNIFHELENIYVAR